MYAPCLIAFSQERHAKSRSVRISIPPTEHWNPSIDREDTEVTPSHGASRRKGRCQSRSVIRHRWHSRKATPNSTIPALAPLSTECYPKRAANCCSLSSTGCLLLLQRIKVIDYVRSCCSMHSSQLSQPYDIREMA